MFTPQDSDNFIAQLEAIEDPVKRFHALSKELVSLRYVTARLTDMRFITVFEMHEKKMSYADISRAANLARSRAQQLVAQGAKLHERTLSGDVSELTKIRMYQARRLDDDESGTMSEAGPTDEA